MNSATVQVRREPATYAYLVITTTERAGAVFQLKQGATSIGRAGGNDIRLDDPAVSSEHAKVRCEGGKEFTLVDLGSANGARLNGRHTQQHALRHNDVIELGETRLVFKKIG